MFSRRLLQIEANDHPRARGVLRRQRGFTLLELMIVIAIIAILVGMAAGIYTKTVQHARESVLRKDLQTMREAIDNYTLDKQQAPQSLQDLVDAGYLRSLPIDPVTQQNDWVLHYSDTVITPEQTGTGVDDVHSGSDQVGADGSPYNTW
ncbi:MAG TPA: prepilin-type N-terminal cleavage/methylation domain-containing protein [Verrucomicrobiae bacterium]|nr:prepilin-type N-terminal cleavage/methylation domain-containing protein [Verrucomicrobiae bacterium]